MSIFGAIGKFWGIVELVGRGIDAISRDLSGKRNIPHKIKFPEPEFSWDYPKRPEEETIISECEEELDKSPDIKNERNEQPEREVIEFKDLESNTVATYGDKNPASRIADWSGGAGPRRNFSDFFNSCERVVDKNTNIDLQEELDNENHDESTSDEHKNAETDLPAEQYDTANSPVADNDCNANNSDIGVNVDNNSGISSDSAVNTADFSNSDNAADFDNDGE